MRRVLLGSVACALALAWYVQRSAVADVAEDTAAAASRGFDALDPALRTVLTPTLAAWIRGQRNTAFARGVAPVPGNVRAALADFVPADVLDRARWRIDDSTLSLQQALFRMGYTPAVTLDDVVVFRTAGDAGDPKLWAHEIVHVRQYRDWGVDAFALRYLADYEAVEHEAAEFRWQWMKRTGRVPEPGRSED